MDRVHPRAPSVPFRVADFLRTEKDIADYIEAMLADGEPRAIPIALRTVADAMGRMTRRRGFRPTPA